MSASTVTIELPSEILHAARITPAELKTDLAVHLFQSGKLSFGKARELTGLTVCAFQQLLCGKGIPVHYDFEMYQEDRTSLAIIEAGRS